MDWQKKGRTVDFYLKTPSRIAAAAEIASTAEEYKKYFDNLAAQCDVDLLRPGVMSQVHGAFAKLKTGISVEELPT